MSVLKWQKYKNWKENHNYGINHHGSADAMEKDLAVEMFCRSVEKHNLRYTLYISDGDTSSFSKVMEALYNKFQNDYPVKKEGCNIGKLKDMQNAIWAIYFHMVVGPSYETFNEQNQYCPATPNSWCRY